MKDYDGLIIFLFGALLAGALVYGFVTIVKNSFSNSPDIESQETNGDGSEVVKKTQAQKMAEIRSNEKRLMEQRQQRLRDFSRR